ncbi:MAG: hypothetical protein WCC48_06725 [Anaeromyxobacteraceae bacterium]
MAEMKKGGGFHALEQRIHQIEDEDAKAEKSAQGQSESAKREAKEEPKSPRKEPK